MEERPNAKAYAHLYQPGQRLDHYLIGELLGQSSDSSVYLAQDQQSQRQVVLKFPHIHEPGSRDIFARYQRTRAIGKRLEHPGIQRHLHEDEARSEEYLVLEYLPGQTLREAINRSAPELLPIARIPQVIWPVVETLALVHEQGVIHRDIKPENILLLEHGGVALLDFGIAQWRGERWLRWRGFARLVGTPAYMAPELLRGRPGSVASDIYAVGVILYEWLCGHTPFQEHNGFELLSEHLSHDPPALLSANPALQPELASVVMRAIRRDPSKRYPSMQALLQALSHLEQVPVEVYCPDAPLIGGRYLLVWRVAALIGLLLLVMIAFGFLAQFAHSSLK